MAPPLQIYQDETFQHRVQQTNDALHRALGPLSSASLNQNVKLRPSNTSSLGLSPMKHDGRSSSPPPEAFAETNLNSIAIPPPGPAPVFTDSLQKHHSSMSPPKMPAQNPGPAPYMMYPSNPLHIDQENIFTPAVYYQNIQPPQKHAAYGQKAPIKRTLMEAAPLQPLKDRTNIKDASKATATSQKAPRKRTLSVATSPDQPVIDRANSKKPKLDEALASPAAEGEVFDLSDLPDPSSLPTPVDPGPLVRPTHSYAQLIGMALLRAPERRLALSGIYKWISTAFTFFKPGQKGWENSIRHNLSLNKSFEKQPREKDDPGKGHYWAIKPEAYHHFLKEKPRRNTHSKSASFINTSTSRPSSSAAPSGPPFPPPPSIPKNIDSSKFPDETELSSDATIPASDPAIHDGIDPRMAATAQAQHIASSPPVQLCSSPPPILPPVVPAAVRRDDTSPVTQHVPANSRAGGNKRKFSAIAGPGDSGYYSSIESSVQKGAHHMPPNRRPGRAEEEISRIRSSSYDSPSKARQTLRPSTATGLPTSSPFQPFDNPKAPLTPPIVFKKPAKPHVASVSPNTNLKNHRAKIKKMLASPNPNLVQSLETPAFEPSSTLKVPGNIWLDDNYTYDPYELMSPVQSPATRGSPEKRPTKRPRLERAYTTDGVVTDVTSAPTVEVFDTSFELSPSRTLHFDPQDCVVLPQSPSSFWPSPVKSTKKANASPEPVFPAPTSHPVEDLPFPRPMTTVPGPSRDVDYWLTHSDDNENPNIDLFMGFRKIGQHPSLTDPLPPSVGLYPTADFPEAHPTPYPHTHNPRFPNRPILPRSSTTHF